MNDREESQEAEQKEDRKADLNAGLRLFIERSGGIEQARETAVGLRAIADGGHAGEYLAGIARMPEAAVQFLAAAQLGFTLSAALFEASKDSEHAVKPT